MNADLMPIISMWTPWAWWVALEWKPIETRTHQRFKKLAGQRIGIHTAQKWDQLWTMQASPYLTPEQHRITSNELLARNGGHVICTAFVKEFRALTAADSQAALINCDPARIEPHPSREGLRYGLFLEDVRQIEPIRVNGRQGIFYDERLVAAR